MFSLIDNLALIICPYEIFLASQNGKIVTT